jgi:dipeptidyl aminopeptidase/acylaminoacyl peptidase
VPRQATLQRLPLLASVNDVVAEKRKAPFGAWPSPLSAETVAEGSVRLGGLALDGEDVYWTQSRPAEQGRQALLRKREAKDVEEVVRAPFSVRTRVHEYGGGAFAVDDGVVIFTNDDDQRLYRIDTTQAAPWRAEALTPPQGIRYADLQIDRRLGRVVCVAERGHEKGEPENFIASVSLASGEVSVLARGADFYAFPRLDAAGERLAFLTWNHPAMPWDACELHVAEIGADGSMAPATKVAGGEDESIFQPAWSPDGILHFTSDRSGYSNLYRVNSDGKVACLCAMEAEFATPLWVFGLSTYAWLDGHTLASVFQKSGFWHLATLNSNSGRLDAIDTELTELGSVFAHDGRALFVGGSAAQAPALYSLSVRSREVNLFHRPSLDLVDANTVAYPKAVSFPTSGGATSHGLLYLPNSPDWEATGDECPPLLVICHGGPTGSTSTALSLNIQFWTTRGFAVLDVNYRGSTGYGRTYRKALDGQWGIADVDDCVAGARMLAAQGLVDGKRMAIRGSSAGGFTVLCALTFHDVFAAGASYYGISDLEALAQDTHKFESHYLESLVGPYPQRRDIYRARSPIHSAERLSCPVIFFQGMEDRVVPPAQAENMVAALRSRGLVAPLVTFPNEQHGFRRKETIVRALTAELAFYREVFGIDVNCRPA